MRNMESNEVPFKKKSYSYRVIADIEIINIAENALRKDVDTFLDMNTAYNNLLGMKKNFTVTTKST